MSSDTTSSQTTLTLITLAEIGEAIGTNLPLDRILHRIVSAVTRLLPSCHAVSIATLDFHNGLVTIHASANSLGDPSVERLGWTRPISELPTVQEILRTGDLLYIPNTLESPLWRQVVFPANQAQAFLGMPLIMEDKILGLFFVDFYKQDPLTDDIRYAIMAFGRYAAAAMHNAQQRDNVRRSELRYRTVANLISNTIYEWTPGADNVEWLGDIDGLLAYPPGQFPRSEAAWLDSIHPNDRKHIADTRQAALNNGSVFEGEYRMRRADGSYCPVMDRGVRFEHGSSAYMLGAIFDLSNTYDLTEALIESETRYRTIFVRSLDAIFIVNKQGYIQDCNPAAEMITKRDYAQLQQASIDELAAPQERQTFKRLIEQLTRQGEFSLQLMHIFRLDNSLVQVELWGTSLGKDLFQIVAHDVSARQRAEALAARRTAELIALSDVTRATAAGGSLSYMLNNVLPDAMNVLDMPLGAIYLRDDSAIANSGLTSSRPGELLQITAHTGIVPGVTPHYPSVMPVTAVHQGQVTGASILARVVDHEVDNAQMPTHPLGMPVISLRVPLIANNDVLGLVMFSDVKPRTFLPTDIQLMDIIGRQLEIGIENVRLLDNLERLVEERTAALWATEARYKSLIEQVPGVVYTAQDLVRDLTFISSGVEPLYGTSPMQMMSEEDALLSRVHDEDQGWVRERAAAMSQAGNDFDAQYRIIDERSGAERWVQHRARLISNERGDAYWLGLLTDVSKLKELDALKSRFVATVSHELRTPLTAIKLRAATLQNYYPRLTDAQRLDTVRRIGYQADILSDLVEDVLRLARLDDGAAERFTNAVDLVNLCEEIIEELSPSVASAGLMLRAAHTLPACYTRADSSDVARVWRNLIGNAIKYTPAPGQILVYTGSVLLDEEGHILTCSLPSDTIVQPADLGPGLWSVGVVVDSGRGISDNDQAHIFTRFYRGEAATSNIPGTGLGLSLVKELLESYSGRIAVRSRQGTGSTFAFWLPGVAAT